MADIKVDKAILAQLITPTVNCEAKDVEALIHALLNGKKWDEATKATGTHLNPKTGKEVANIGYSRGWLIAREYMALAQPVKGYFLEATPQNVVMLREQGCSWGEIMIRVRKPEGQVSKLFEEAAPMKRKGLRVGKGGRFVYDDQTLYDGERRKEGALIPKELKGRPTPDQLLNAPKADEGAKPKQPAKKPVQKKAVPKAS